MHRGRPPERRTEILFRVVSEIQPQNILIRTVPGIFPEIGKIGYPYRHYRVLLPCFRISGFLQAAVLAER